MIELVCFDLGGVLVRIARTWQEACRAAGVPVRPLDGSGRAEAALELWSLRLHAGEVTLAEYCAGLAAALDHRFSGEEVEAAHRAVLRGDYEHVGEVVAAVRAARVKTALLSNTNAAHFEQLRDGATVRQLDHLFVSHELGLLKPGPAIYAHVEAATGAAPGSIAFFDDTLENVEAARARGWRAHRVRHAEPTAPQMLRALAEWGVLTGQVGRAIMDVE